MKNRYSLKHANLFSGFTLVELMISISIGLVVSLGVVQVMVSNRVTNEFNQTIADVQESGRFAVTRLKNELLETGLYDSVYTSIVEDVGVDMTAEQAFVRNHPVILANHLAANLTLTSSNGGSGSSDQLVISLQSETDCTGARYRGNAGEEQHIINRYFVSGDELQCQGYDGRVARGVLSPSISDSNGPVTIMDEVKSFQVQYGISSSLDTSDSRAVRYVTADQLAAAEDAGQMVVSVRIGVLIQSKSELSEAPEKEYTLLDEAGLSVDSGHYGQVFSHTVALRNMKNFVRSI